MTKTCTKCGIEKSVDEFYFRKDSKKYRNECKLCQKQYHDDYYKKNEEKLRLASREYRTENIEECRQREKNYYYDNREIILPKHKIYRENNKEKIAISKKKWYVLNEEYVTEKAKIYVENNRDSINARLQIYKKERRLVDVNFALKEILSSRIRMSIKNSVGKKSNKTEELLGASVEDVRNYIESKFEPGMNWNNHELNGWHLDHIIPCSAFDLTNIEEQRVCFHYLNLQPMWGSENIKKGGANKKDYTKEKEQFILILKDLGII